MDKTTFELGGGKPRQVYTPKALTCNNCGAPIALYSERTQLIVCDACGMRLDCSDTELQALGKETQKTNFSLSINQDFVWEETKYKIIGAIRTKDSWGEYTENYLLFHPFKGTIWAAKYIEDGSAEYFISKNTRMIPREDVFSIPKGQRITTATGGKWKKKEAYTTTVTDVMGALPWVAKIGDVSKIVELTSTSQHRQTLEAEQSQESKEIEFCLTQRISARQFYAALGLSESEAMKAFPYEKKGVSVEYIILAIILFIVFSNMFFGGGSGGSYSSGRSYSGGGFSGGK